MSNLTSGEQPKTTRSVYDACDPKYLRDLREAAGMDVFVLARTACLSVAQVRQLETDDSDNLFYSDAIKRQAYKRLLMILGAEPPTAEVPEDLRDANKVAQAHLDTLDQIVAMSHQPSLNRTAIDVLREGWAKLRERQQAIGALLFLAAAVVVFVMYGPLNSAIPESMTASAPTTSSVQPLPATPVVDAPPITPVRAASALASSEVAPIVVATASATVAASAPLAAASVPAVVASAASTPKLATCAYVSEALPQLSSLFANKDGRYVYLVSATPADICVVDGNKQATVLQLKAGEGRSVYGTSPWQVSGAHLQKIQIYFQGGRVTVPDNAARGIQLVEVPLAR